MRDAITRSDPRIKGGYRFSDLIVFMSFSQEGWGIELCRVVNSWLQEHAVLDGYMSQCSKLSWIFVAVDGWASMRACVFVCVCVRARCVCVCVCV